MPTNKELTCSEIDAYIDDEQRVDYQVKYN